MMSQDQNDRLTRVGQGTAAGELLRMYWQPVALADELEADRPLRPVRLMGQEYILFRDDNGRIGFIDRFCPHRGADLAFGRLEDGGLRCPFHGWLFDADGQCLETPAEPEGSRLCQAIRQPSYPVMERNGIWFAYIGAGEAPAFPEFDCFVAAASHTFAFKGLIECNWLQALEVGIDPAHASYLHRFFEDEDPGESYGKQFRGASIGSDLPMTKILREFEHPDIEFEDTSYGMRIRALRELDESNTHVRITNLYFPQAFVIPLSSEMSITQWHVPIDDYHCYWYAIFTSFTDPVNRQEMRAQRLKLYELPDYRSRKNRSNSYGYDPEEQKTQTFTGMGFDINVHDQWAVESLGRIQDRTREHLGTTDKVISAYRRLLLKSIKQAAEGETPLMVLSLKQAESVTGPAVLDGIGPSDNLPQFARQSEQTRRQACPWLQVQT
jgi:phthalate 4,5-dioxygenase oxygenase subunit